MTMRIMNISVDDDFDIVLKEMDKEVQTTQTSRSAIIRNLCYDHYNIPRPNRKDVNREKFYRNKPLRRPHCKECGSYLRKGCNICIRCGWGSE